MASIFTKILSKELPSYKIHEDDLTYSFLALDQVNLGHTLVICKQEINAWWEVPAEIYTRVHLNSQKIGKAMKIATECPRVGQMVAGFEVPHYHLHLIPAWSIPDLSFAKARRYPEEEMKRIQAAIIKNL